MKAFQAIKDLVTNFGDYLETRMELMKLRFVEKTSRLLAWIIAATILFFTLCCMVLFLSLAAAHGIGDALGKPWLGYLVVAGFYAVLGMIAWFGREKLFRLPLMNAILEQVHKGEQEKEYEGHEGKTTGKTD